MLPLGKLVAPPCQAWELGGQGWQRQSVPASWPRQCKWQMGWGPLGKKGGKRGEVACGSLIESRSGLSWWGGGDDREGDGGQGWGKDYKASGSLTHPVGWPQALALTLLSPLYSTFFTSALPPSLSFLFRSLLFFPLPSHPSPQRNRGEKRAYQALPRMCED